MKVERPLCHLWEFTPESPKTLSNPFQKWCDACLTYTHLHTDVESSSLGNLQNLMQLNAGHVLVRLYHLGTFREDVGVGICSVQVRVALVLFPPEFGSMVSESAATKDSVRHIFKSCPYGQDLRLSVGRSKHH